MDDNLTDLQCTVFKFIKWWADTKKTVIPQKEIIIFMKEKHDEKSYNVLWTINALIEKGYIRKAYTEQQRRTFYVMIRNL